MITDQNIDSHIGETYGYFTIVGLCEDTYKNGHKKYHVRCNDCGQEFDSLLCNIKKITSTSCKHSNKQTEGRVQEIELGYHLLF